MPHEIGFVDNTSGFAHYAMLAKIHDLAVASGWWQVLRYNTAGEVHELILQGQGYTGLEEIFVGFRTYHSTTADYYNMTVAGFTGYVPGNSFETQPGFIASGIPAHNNRIDYWLTVGPQRIALAMKVGTPVYESCYVGKFLPYATPSQYPYPIVVAGMLDGEPLTRFSDSSHSMPYKGDRANLRMRFVDGAWLQPETYPWNNQFIAAGSFVDISMRDTGGSYKLLPVVLTDSNNVYGELEGIFYISGFDNAVENTLTVDGVNYVVIQDVGRTGFIDYYALQLDANGV